MHSTPILLPFVLFLKDLLARGVLERGLPFYVVMVDDKEQGRPPPSAKAQGKHSAKSPSPRTGNLRQRRSRWATAAKMRRRHAVLRGYRFATLKVRSRGEARTAPRHFRAKGGV